MRPLYIALEISCAKAEKRKKNTLKNIPLHTMSWGTDRRIAIASIQDSLRKAVKMKFSKHDHGGFVYTDASENLCSAVVTQTEKNQLSKAIEQQKHDPLAFWGGRFNKSQRYWTTFEKKTYVMVQTFDRLNCLFCEAKHTHVFTDHKNLFYLFATLALRLNSARHILFEVHRWAMHLSIFEFFIDHIERADNVFVDIVTLWSKGYGLTTTQTNMIAALNDNIIPTSTDMDVTSITGIKREQANH